jgi:hypothetical protein
MYVAKELKNSYMASEETDLKKDSAANAGLPISWRSCTWYFYGSHPLLVIEDRIELA